jgi:hypothetical protein
MAKDTCSISSAIIVVAEVRLFYLAPNWQTSDATTRIPCPSHHVSPPLQLDKILLEWLFIMAFILFLLDALRMEDVHGFETRSICAMGAAVST